MRWRNTSHSPIMDTKKSDSKKEQPRQNEYIKVCSINICGLSERSRFMLDKYVFDKQIDIVCVQETGSTDPSKLNLCNMNAATDSNKAANKGCALFVRSGISSTPLPEISKISSAQHPITYVESPFIIVWCVFVSALTTSINIVQF